MADYSQIANIVKGLLGNMKDEDDDNSEDKMKQSRELAKKVMEEVENQKEDNPDISTVEIDVAEPKKKEKNLASKILSALGEEDPDKALMSKAETPNKKDNLGTKIGKVLASAAAVDTEPEQSTPQPAPSFWESAQKSLQTPLTEGLEPLPSPIEQRTEEIKDYWQKEWNRKAGDTSAYTKLPGAGASMYEAVGTPFEQDVLGEQPEPLQAPTVEPEVVEGPRLAKPMEREVAQVVEQTGNAPVSDNQIIDIEKGEPIGKGTKNVAVPKTKEHEAYEKMIEQYGEEAMFNQFDKRIRINEEIDTINKKIEEARAAIKGANILGSGNTFQKVMAGIGLALGAAAQVDTGVNSGYEILKKNQDNIISMNKDLLDSYLKKLDNLDTARMAVEDDMDQITLNVIEKRMELANPGTQLKLTQLKESIENSRIQRDYVKTQIAKNNVETKEIETKIEQQENLRQLGVTKETVQYLPKEQQENVVFDPKTEDLLGIAPNKERANKIAETVVDARNSEKAINNLIDLAKNSSRLDIKRRAKVYTSLNALVGSLRMALLGPGVMTEAEYQRVLKVLGDPNKIFSFDTIEAEKLRTTKNMILDKANFALKGAGLKPLKGTSITFKEKR